MKEIHSIPKKIMMTALLVAVVILLTGCPATGTDVPVIPNEIYSGDSKMDTSKRPVDAENPGALLVFSYEYGSFHEGYWQFVITRMEDILGGEHIYFRAEGMNDVDLFAVAEIEQNVLDDIAQIISGYGIFGWNGFSKRDDDVLDGYGFSLAAEFTNGTLTADGYMKEPEHYDGGHAALSEYLLKLAQDAEVPMIENVEGLERATINFAEGFSVQVDLSYAGNIPAISYIHGDHRENYSVEEVGRDALTEYVDYITSLYNEYRDVPQNTGDNPFASLYITGNAHAGNLEYRTVIDATQYPDVYAELLNKTLSVLRKSPDHLASEEYETETYKNSFMYSVVYLYEVDGLGKVIIDLPEQTLTVDGIVYTVSRQDMKDLNNLIGGNLPATFSFVRSASQLYNSYPKPDETPEGILDGFIDQGNVWIFGRKHHRNALHLYGGVGELPEGWDKARGLVEELLEKSVAEGEQR